MIDSCEEYTLESYKDNYGWENMTDEEFKDDYPDKYELLKEAGKLDKPVLLKRGMSSSIKEFLLSAEYILCQGNKNVILCERGIRTFENAYRNTLDITAIPIIQELSHLPLIVDPSHACGKWNYIGPLSLSAIAAGANGVMIEVHDKPDEAFSDAEQALKPERLDDIIFKISELAKILNKKLIISK